MSSYGIRFPVGVTIRHPQRWQFVEADGSALIFRLNSPQEPRGFIRHFQFMTGDFVALGFKAQFGQHTLNPILLLTGLGVLSLVDAVAVTASGIMPNFPDPESLITNDYIRPFE